MPNDLSSDEREDAAIWRQTVAEREAEIAEARAAFRKTEAAIELRFAQRLSERIVERIFRDRDEREARAGGSSS